ncbi:MAG: thiamine pyrophosphate-binding protein [Sulfitobacter sp.]
MADPHTRPLGAQISHMLKDRGVEVIFGIPGVHNQEMYRGIEEAGITHVLARHEQGAGFMADGYARATGSPGVAYVITGPGVCNIMTPMGQAYSDSVPLLVISSCLDETAARRGQLHQMKDQRAAAATVCDWSEEARTAQAAYTLIDRAFSEYQTDRPRPKHIQVPIHQLESEAAPGWDRFYEPAYARPVPLLDKMDTVAHKMRAARRPLFVFGGGAKTAFTQARQVLEMTNAASFCTYAGRGIVAPDNPLYFGSYLARPDSANICAKADLLVLVGTDMAEVDLWRADSGASCHTVHVNIDAEVLACGQAGDSRIFSDANEFLRGLGARLQEHTPATDWAAKEVSAARSKWRTEVEAEYPGIPGIADALRSCLPEKTMIYSDMTQFAYCAKEIWDMDHPGHWHHPYGFGTLGYALPAAIGGAIGRTGKPTMAIIGDYGFHYTMQELGVAVELGLPIPIILWDNGKLGAIEASMVGAQIAPNAVVARNPDFVKLAEAFGAAAVAPDTLDELQKAVQAAFNAEGPTLIYLTPAISG